MPRIYPAPLLPNLDRRLEDPNIVDHDFDSDSEDSEEAEERINAVTGIKTEEQLISESRARSGYHTCHCFKELIQDDDNAALVIRKLKGKTHRRFLFTFWACLLVTYVIGIAAIVLTIMSLVYDFKYSSSLKDNDILTRNEVHLAAIFGEDFYRVFRRESRLQAIFLFTFAGWTIFYTAFIVCFAIKNTYRLQVLLNGFLHFLMVFHYTGWCYLLYKSLLDDAQAAVDLGIRIRNFVASPHNVSSDIIHNSLFVGQLFDLIHDGLTIFEYCDKSLSDIPDDLRPLLDRWALCPDNESKTIVLALTCTNWFSHALLFISSLVWRCSSIDIAQMGEGDRGDFIKSIDSTRIRTSETNISTSSTDSEEDEEYYRQLDEDARVNEELRVMGKGRRDTNSSLISAWRRRQSGNSHRSDSEDSVTNSGNFPVSVRVSNARFHSIDDSLNILDRRKGTHAMTKARNIDEWNA